MTRNISSRDAVDDLRAMEVQLKVPCRKCARCLDFRKFQWRQRAVSEIERAWKAGRRSWRVTLTFSPHHLAGVLLESKTGEPRSIELAAYRHVQKYFKRLRKEGCAFRYLAVYERGEKTGRSHYHLLLHELGPRPITKAVIDQQWRSNVHARLVECSGRAASYITSYTTKDFAYRPRASQGYGKNSPPPSSSDDGGHTLHQGKGLTLTPKRPPTPKE